MSAASGFVELPTDIAGAKRPGVSFNRTQISISARADAACSMHAPLIHGAQASPPTSPLAAHFEVTVPPGGATAPAPESAPHLLREFHGLLLTALSTVFGSGMSLFAKLAGNHGLGVFEIVLARSLILVLFTAPELLWRRINPFADPRRRWLLVARGVLGFLAVSSLYWSVSLNSLADSSTLQFLSPIFVAVLSPLILGERSSRGVLLGIPVAMLGVVLVAQPTFLGFGGAGGISLLGAAVGVCQALCNSLSRMTVRALSVGSKEPMASIIFGQGIISCVGAALASTTGRTLREPLTPGAWGALLAGGLLGYLYQVCLTAGLQRARAAPAVSMSYISILWSLLADLLAFHHAPDALSLVGAALVCGSSCFVALDQKRQPAAVAGGSSSSSSTDCNGGGTVGMDLETRIQQQAAESHWEGHEDAGEAQALLLPAPAAKRASGGWQASSVQSLADLLWRLKAAAWSRRTSVGGASHGTSVAP